MIGWEISNKGDTELRRFFELHYTRQTPFSPGWLRPGYNLVLRWGQPCVALFIWWRPKWENGTPGTERKDKLRVLECTVFRRIGGECVASDMIKQAVLMLYTKQTSEILHLETAGSITTAITYVSGLCTFKRRSKKHRPGHCFIKAGWKPDNDWSSFSRLTLPIFTEES